MTNGNVSLDQRSDNTQTTKELEDRTYYTLGGNIFSKGYFDKLKKYCPALTNYKKYPAQIDPFWVDQLENGWKQYEIYMKRDGSLRNIRQFASISLFYNSSTPYYFRFYINDIIVTCLAKDEEHAIAHANKKRIENFLHKGWLKELELSDKRKTQ